MGDACYYYPFVVAKAFKLVKSTPTATTLSQKPQQLDYHGTMSHCQSAMQFPTHDKQVVRVKSTQDLVQQTGSPIKHVKRSTNMLHHSRHSRQTFSIQSHSLMVRYLTINSKWQSQISTRVPLGLHLNHH